MKPHAKTSSLRFDFPLPQPRSMRTKLVAHWFGLTWPKKPDAQETVIDDAQLISLVPKPGEILFIGGPSGAGKSSLLAALVQLMETSQPPLRAVDLNTIVLPDRPLVDCFEGFSLRRVLKLLSMVGLAEAWTYLRTPAEVSEGQRWRLKLARALSESDGSATLVCDEFAAVLDRVTAAVVARSLRRAISSQPSLRAIIATSHDDLMNALQPNRIVRCDFGSIEVVR